MDKNYSFKKGLDKVPVGKFLDVKEEIMECLKITSHPAWLRRLRGEVIPKVNEVAAIEEVFKKHSIKDIWGT